MRGMQAHGACPRSPAKAGVQTRREAPNATLPRGSFLKGCAPAFAGALLLTACNGVTAPVENAAVPPDLESAAIERGMVRDPGDPEIAGL